MAREYARVQVAIWAGDFRADLTPAAQHLYFVLMTSPSVSMCGVVDWRPKRIAGFAKGWTEADVRAAADELEAARYVVVDEDTEEILVRSFMRHDHILKSPNMARAAVKDWMAASSERVRAAVVAEAKRAHSEDPSLPGFRSAVELLSSDLSESERPKSNESETLPTSFGSISPILQPATCNQQPATCNPHPPSGRRVTRSARDTRTAPRFDEFWTAYPRHAARANAVKAWAKAIDREDPDTILAAIPRLAAAWAAHDPKFTPHPATWLNRDGWHDDPVKPPDTRSRGQVERDARIAHWATLTDDQPPPRPQIGA